MKDKFVENLETVLDAYCEATGLTKTKVQEDALGSHSFMYEVSRGASFTVDRYCKLYAHIHENWPKDMEWPQGCILPTLQYPPSRELDAENVSQHV